MFEDREKREEESLGRACRGRPKTGIPRSGFHQETNYKARLRKKTMQ
jgi:hypothetical protein